MLKGSHLCEPYRLVSSVLPIKKVNYLWLEFLHFCKMSCLSFPKANILRFFKHAKFPYEFY